MFSSLLAQIISCQTRIRWGFETGSSVESSNAHSKSYLPDLRNLDNWWVISFWFSIAEIN